MDRDCLILASGRRISSNQLPVQVDTFTYGCSGRDDLHSVNQTLKPNHHGSIDNMDGFLEATRSKMNVQIPCTLDLQLGYKTHGNSKLEWDHREVGTCSVNPPVSSIVGTNKADNVIVIACTRGRLGEIHFVQI